LLACAFGPGLVANLLKLSFSRLRPTYFDEAWPQSISETWIAPFPAVFDARNEFGIYFASSFPSGHAATAFGLAIGLSWLFPAGRVPFFTLAVMASLQRIVGNAHWLSDTLFGLSLAVLIAGSLAANWRGTRWLARWESRQRGGIDEGTRSEA
jgi:membrane-associated phospholipid phosphatase